MPDTQVDLRVLSRGSGTNGGYSNMPLPRSQWKSRVLLPAVVIASFAIALAYSARDALWPAKPVSTVQVVVKAATGNSGGGVAFQAAGWVEPAPYATTVAALTDGVVKEVPVLEGQRIEAGAVVARMIDEDAKIAVTRAEASVLEHTANVKVAEVNLAAAQKQWENPIERVRAVSVAENMLAEAKSELIRLDTDIQVEIARADELVEQARRENIASTANAIPEFQKIQTQLKLKTQQATVAATKAKRGPMEAKIKQLEAEVVAAKDNLKLRIAELKELEAAKASLQQAHALHQAACTALDDAKLRLERMEIRAAVGGVVLERLVEPGAKMMLNGNEMNSARAVRLYEPKKLQVRVDVPLGDAARVSVDQDALIVVEVLRETTFKGKVSRILHQADLQKNTLQVKVTIIDPAPELKPEMLARVQFVNVAQAAPKEAVQTLRVFAPENLLQKQGGQAHAWIVDKGRGIATRKAVTLGSAHQDGWVEVTQGLQAGDSLIEGDTNNLHEGEKVKIQGEGMGGGEHGSH